MKNCAGREDFEGHRVKLTRVCRRIGGQRRLLGGGLLAFPNPGSGRAPSKVDSPKKSEKKLSLRSGRIMGCGERFSRGRRRRLALGIEGLDGGSEVGFRV